VSRTLPGCNWAVSGLAVPMRAVAAILIWLCAFAELASAQAKPAAPIRKTPPNVILITIDTVRADHLGCYGYSKIQTPTLDALAHDGILFNRAISQVPLTWPSHTAILTGTYPFQNGVQDFTGQPLDPQFRSVAQAFKKNGYATGAVVSAYVLDRVWGLARGFDFYDDAFAPETFQQKDLGLVDRKADPSVTHALRWLTRGRQQGTRPRPFFLWLHLYDPHSPYDPPEPYRTEYRDHPYDGEIAYTDHELERLITWLKRNQLYDRTLIVVVSDHGESLGEHGESEHGYFVYNSTVRIPLIMKPPAGSGFPPGHISRPVETTSVAPTLLQLAGLKDEIQKQFTSSPLFEQSKLRQARPEQKSEDDQPAYSETFYTFNSFGWSPLHSLETARYHYIDAPRPELYELAADPDEKNNLASQQTATVAVLKEKLQALLRRNPFKASSSINGGVTADAAEKLRALGYVAYHSPIPPEAIAAGLPDPKDKLAEFNTILAAQDAFRLRNFASGEALLEKIQQQDPQMYIVPFMLGQAASKEKDWPKSEAAFRRCLELNPNFDQAMTGLARALFFQGKDDEAKQWARNALKLNASDYKALYELASIESRTDAAAAIADYEKAIALQGNFAPVRRDLGMLYFKQQNYSQAAVELAKALELGLRDARLLNFLGICYDRTNRVQKAISTYRQALELDDSLPEAHLNLGYTYHRQGHEELAAREYRRACELKQEFCKMVRSGKVD
jgi:arylsulfatase A-like enzyme/Flp pilus assembly protein TadD